MQQPELAMCLAEVGELPVMKRRGAFRLKRALAAVVRELRLR